MEEWVFVDTCIWASFFAKPGSPEKAAVDDLLDSDRVALVGPILAEVLLGFRRREGEHAPLDRPVSRRCCSAL